MLNGLNI